MIVATHLEIHSQRPNQMLLFQPKVWIADQNPCVKWNQRATNQITYNIVLTILPWK